MVLFGSGSRSSRLSGREAMMPKPEPEVDAANLRAAMDADEAEEQRFEEMAGNETSIADCQAR